jgi:4-amino-4-deoxy-L-arabinose transferase-like glycosyltransferase
MPLNFAGERLLLTLWVGALWAIGYLAVPLAFVTFDQTTAGNYAGVLFQAVNMLGQLSGAVLILTKLYQHRGKVMQYWRFWLLLAMVLITLLFSFYLHPEMADIKQQGWQTNAELKARFDLLHSLSESAYLMLSLLGLILVLSSDKQHDSVS